MDTRAITALTAVNLFLFYLISGNTNIKYTCNGRAAKDHGIMQGFQGGKYREAVNCLPLHLYIPPARLTKR